MPPTPPTDEAGWQRWFAVELFNHTWGFLDKKDDLTEEEKDEMLAAAMASRFHWGKVGEPRNHAIGDWQISRVYAQRGNGPEAVRYGQKSLNACVEHALGPFFTGYAHEAIARGRKLEGDQAEYDKHLQLAHNLAEKIDKDEDRQMLLDDLRYIEGM
ncbi:MAG: hypothetical protein ACIAXF_17170 [Phycisphaerales bacterium JB063]